MQAHARSCYAKVFLANAFTQDSRNPLHDIVEGFDVLDKIAEMDTYGPETWNKPVVMPVIKSIRVTSDIELPPVVRLP